MEDLTDIKEKYSTLVDLEEQLKEVKKYYQEIFLAKVTEIENLLNQEIGNGSISEINEILSGDWRSAFQREKNSLLDFGITDISITPKTGTLRFLAHTILREALFQSSNIKGTCLGSVSNIGTELPDLLKKAIQKVSAMFRVTASFSINKGSSEMHGDWEDHVVIFSKIK